MTILADLTFLKKIVRLATHYPILAVSTLMPLFLIILVRVRKIRLKNELKMMYWFCVFFFISDLPLWITTGLHINNLSYFFFREIAIQTFLICIYYNIISSSVKRKIILTSLISLGIISIVIFFISSYYHQEAPTQINAVYKLVLIIIIFDYFHTLISKKKTRSFSDYPFFWVSSGLFIASTSSIFVYLFYNYTFLTPSITFFKFFTQYVDVLVILMFIFMGIGFVKAKKYYLNE